MKYLIIFIPFFSYSFDHFKKININEMKSLIKKDIIYTNSEIMSKLIYKKTLQSYELEEIEELKRKNSNLFDYSRQIYNDNKYLYFGWTKYDTIYNSESQIYCILEIIKSNLNSLNILKIQNIVENPKLILDYNDIQMFNRHINALAKINNMTINFENLKSLNNGRWYLNLIYIK